MQTLRSILRIGSGGTALTDEFGSESGIQLELMLGTACRLEFDLRGEPEKEDSQLPVFPALDAGSCAFYFALDSKNSNSAQPALLRYNSITLEKDSKGHNIFAVELPNNASDAVLAAMQGVENSVFRAEIGGIDGEGATVFAWQFDLTIRSRVYLGEADESVFSDPAYYTAVQIEAMLNHRDEQIIRTISGEIGDQVSIGSRNPMEFQFSADGENEWHELQNDSDRFFRQRIANLDAAWSNPIALIAGTPGTPGHTPVKGVDYWTEADKSEIKQYVNEAVLNGSW